MTGEGEELLDDRPGRNAGSKEISPTSASDGRQIIKRDLSAWRDRTLPDAQTDAVDVRSGIRVGLNFATFGGDEAEAIRTVLRRLPNVADIDGGRRTGLTVGAFIRADFGGLVGLQPEIRYIQKGTQTAFSARNAEGEVESGRITVKIDYVEIPILTRAALPKIGPVVPHGLAGTTFGFSVNTGSNLRLGERSKVIDTGGDLGGNAISLEFGAGGDVEIGTTTVTADARFGLGLSDVPGVRFSAQNRGIIVTAGIVF
jgi:hypothetical protein